MTHFILPLLIAAAGITVAQLHGVQSWIALFGSAWLGWVVSLTWEAASVWLWWRGDRTWTHRLAKWAATLALVGGMVAPSAAPLLRSASQGETARRVLSVLESQSAAGHWISQRTLKQAFAASDGVTPWALTGAAWATVAALPALYALALLALTTVAREWRSGPGSVPVRAPSPAVTNTPANVPRTSHEPGERPERAAMLDYARRHGLTRQSEVANAIGEHRSTFSEFVNGRANPEQRARILGKLGGEHHLIEPALP